MPQTDLSPTRAGRRRTALKAGAGLVSCLLVAGAIAMAAMDGSGGTGPEAEAAGDPASLRLGLASAEVRLDGELTEGTAKRLRRLLRAHPDVKLVTLTSEGGLVDEAEQIGDIVAAHGLSTYVPDYCASACTLAFVRGRERLVATGGQVGFHAPWVPDPSGREVQVGSEEETQSYIAAGIAPDFTAEAMKVPSSDIWFPEPARLLAARVATAYVDPGELPLRIERLPASQRRWASAAAP